MCACDLNGFPVQLYKIKKNLLKSYKDFKEKSEKLNWFGLLNLSRDNLTIVLKYLHGKQ